MRKLLVTGVVACGLAWLGCRVTKTSTVSCTSPGTGVCTERDTAKTDDAKKACSGTFAQRACDRTGAVGTCASRSGADNVTTVYTAPATAASAASGCRLLTGTYSASNGPTTTIVVTVGTSSAPGETVIPDPPAPTAALTGSCKLTSVAAELTATVNSCRSYFAGNTADDIATKATDCTDMANDEVKADWTAAGGCATAGAVTSCAIEDGDALERRWAYAGSDQGEEEKSCTDDNGKVVKAVPTPEEPAPAEPAPAPEPPAN